MLQVRKMLQTPNWNHWCKALCIIVLLLTIPLWIVKISPTLLKLPDNFTYNAELLSLDNFFDEQADKFQGPHISKSTFSYNVIGKKQGYLVINNTFTVRTLNNKPIISFTRSYFINPYNSMHVSIPGEQQRVGYLFGPRFANINGFDYWHVNYDAPAHLTFVDKEKINNLTVYHYQAQYQADQTTNLTHLPGVPQKRGVKVDIVLQLWIEPVSGWLIKYQDNSLAYYYDQDTGAKLSNWNSFTNQYTQNSIHQQVKIATFLKWKIITIEFIIPILIFLIACTLLFHLTRSAASKDKSISNYSYIFKIIISYFIIIVLLCILGGSIYYFFWHRTQTHIYKIGISEWYNSPELLATVKGFKDGLAEYGFEEGKNTQFLISNPKSNIQNQIDTIQSFISDKVDLIFTLSTPGTLVAKGITKDIPIVFSDVTYPVESNLIASLDSSQNNLVGTRNYISPAAQFNAYEKIIPNAKVIGFVHHEGDPNSEIQYQEYKNLLIQRNIKVIDIPVIDLDDLNLRLTQQKGIDTLFSACDTLIQAGGGAMVANFSLKNKIPSFSCDLDTVQNGALMGYVADPYAIGKLAGKKAALILRGADPSWLQTESPTTGYLIINLKTAKALNINVPDEIINKANKIIK